MKLDDNVPVPGNSATKYPFATMKVGQSFVMDERDRSKLSVACSSQARRFPGTKFTIRKDGNGKIRCWRVA